MRESFLTIINNSKANYNEKVLCRCVCGNEKMIGYGRVRDKKIISCGCHGKGLVPKDVKRTFSLMKYRCETPTSPDYDKWGAVGIKVLYKDVEEFYKDVGDKPSSKHSIDRIDGKKSYQVGNCRWATQTEQSNNVKSNRNFLIDGTIKTIAQISKEYDINYTTLKHRLDKGLSVDEAIAKPISEKHSKAGKISQEKRL